LGRGTAVDRAWVFILLCRQQGLDAVMLAIAGGPAPASENGKDGKDVADATSAKNAKAGGRSLQAWAVGVLSEGEVYVFDPGLGLPIPGPGGIRRDGGGQLDIRPATLAQLAADDGLLRQLDAAPNEPYPVKAAQLASVVAWIETSPSGLSERMKVVESQLAGDAKWALTSNPSAEAKRLKACRSIGAVQWWPLPYETTLQHAVLGSLGGEWQMAARAPFMIGKAHALNAARIRHLGGRFAGENAAIAFYQMAPSARQLAGMLQVHHPELRPSLRAKQDAAYWLGLVKFEQGDYATAADWLNAATPKADPNGPWSGGATYNLARVDEAQGNFPQAILAYRQPGPWPDRAGRELRARWLETLVKAEAKPAETKTEKPVEKAAK
jgi:hypothetical protein